MTIKKLPPPLSIMYNLPYLNCPLPRIQLGGIFAHWLLDPLTDSAIDPCHRPSVCRPPTMLYLSQQLPCYEFFTRDNFTSLVQNIIIDGTQNLGHTQLETLLQSAINKNAQTMTIDPFQIINSFIMQILWARSVCHTKLYRKSHVRRLPMSRNLPKVLGSLLWCRFYVLIVDTPLLDCFSI